MRPNHPRPSERPTATAAPAPQSEDVEGCALITQAEVSAAVGATVGAGKGHSLRGCTWTAEPGIVVRLVVYPAGAETCKGQEFLVTGRQEEVPDLGDSALWGSSGDLVVCSGKGVFKLI